MNKAQKIIIAILGGIEATFSLISPILLVLLWVKITGLTGFGSYLLYTMGILSSVFRGIKIGWLKE